MNNPTKMMNAILQSKKAQEIIDYVSQIYGESYVGLWLFEVIGQALDEAAVISEQLLEETTPVSANLLIDYWEDEYGIVHDDTLSIEQRRQRIMAKIQSRRAVNPAVLTQAVSSALDGATIVITENTDKNTFKVNVRTSVRSVNPAKKVLEEMKPAHLIYEMQLVVITDASPSIKTAMAVTRGETYNLTVHTSEDPVGVIQTENNLAVLFGVTALQTGDTITIS